MRRAAPGSSSIAVNARVLAHSTVGVVRYATEILRRLPGPVERIAPGCGAVHGIAGHGWEQMVLPWRVGRRLLWSPANTGPLMIGRQVVTVHDLSTLDLPDLASPLFGSWYRWLLPRLVRRVSAVVAVSGFTKGRIVEACSVPESKVTVVYNGVDQAMSPRPDSEVAEMRRRLALPGDRYFLALGTVEPRKNIGRLVEAWRRVSSSFPDDVWLILAGGTGEPRIFRDAGLGPLPDRVHLTGRIEEADLATLYSGALAHVYVSLYEGFGLPPLEAMACGCPVIAAEAAAVPEICGSAAKLVDPHDVNAIAKAMSEMYCVPALRDRLRHDGLKRARQFTWDRAAEQTWRVFDAVAGQNS